MFLFVFLLVLLLPADVVTAVSLSVSSETISFGEELNLTFTGFTAAAGFFQVYLNESRVHNASITGTTENILLRPRFGGEVNISWATQDESGWTLGYVKPAHVNAWINTSPTIAFAPAKAPNITVFLLNTTNIPFPTNGGIINVNITNPLGSTSSYQVAVDGMGLAGAPISVPGLTTLTTNIIGEYNVSMRFVPNNTMEVYPAETRTYFEVTNKTGFTYEYFSNQSGSIILQYLPDWTYWEPDLTGYCRPLKTRREVENLLIFDQSNFDCENAPWNPSERHFGMSFWAQLVLPANVTGTPVHFFLQSDDGSSIIIWEADNPFPGYYDRVVDNDGAHNVLWASGSMMFNTSNRYYININYFQEHSNLHFRAYINSTKFSILTQNLCNGVACTALTDFLTPINSKRVQNRVMGHGYEWEFFNRSVSGSPDWAALVPDLNGTTRDTYPLFDVSMHSLGYPTLPERSFGWRFTANLIFPKGAPSGEWTVALYSDDGAALYFYEESQPVNWNGPILKSGTLQWVFTNFTFDVTKRYKISAALTNTGGGYKLIPAWYHPSMTGSQVRNCSSGTSWTSCVYLDLPNVALPGSTCNDLADHPPYTQVQSGCINDRIGDNCTFTCVDHAYPVSGSPVRTCQGINYTTNDLVCEPITCIDLAAPPGHARIVSGCIKDLVGDSCVMDCTDDADYVSGSKIRTCNGFNYTMNDLVCQPKTCVDNAQPPPYTQRVSGCIKDQVGQNCSYACSQNATYVSGSRTRTCQGLNYTTNDLVCRLKTCVDLVAQPLHTRIVNGCINDTIGENCTMACFDNATHVSGSTVRVCNGNDYDTNDLVCELKTCVDLVPLPLHTQIVSGCIKDLFGETCIMSCSDDANYISGSTVRECDGNNYTTNDLVCELKTCVDLVPLPPYAQIVNGCIHDTIGENCTMTCFDNATYISGSTVRVCNGNDYDTNDLVCQLKTCADNHPLPPLTKVMSGCTLNDTIGDNCTLACHDNATHITGSAVRVCAGVDYEPSDLVCQVPTCADENPLPQFSYIVSGCINDYINDSCILGCNSTLSNYYNGSFSRLCSGTNYTASDLFCTGICEANTYQKGRSCYSCDRNARSDRNSTVCTCNAGYSGDGYVCFVQEVFNDLPKTPNKVLEVTLLLDLYNVNNNQTFLTQFKQDVGTVLDLDPNVISIISVKNTTNGTEITFGIRLPATDNRTLYDVARNLHSELTTPNSTLFSTPTLSKVNPNYVVFSLFDYIVAQFEKIGFIYIFTTLGICLLVIALIYLWLRKYYPHGENLRLVWFLFALVAVASKLFFVTGLWRTLSDNDLKEKLEWAKWLATASLVVPCTLNVIIGAVIWSDELRRNPKLWTWVREHWVAMTMAASLCWINTRVWRLLTSEIAGIEAFGAPMMRKNDLALQSFGLNTLFLSDIPQLLCQIYVSYMFDTVESNASLAFLFTLISLLTGLVTQSLALKRLCHLTSKRKQLQTVSQESHTELEFTQTESMTIATPSGSERKNF